MPKSIPAQQPTDAQKLGQRHGSKQDSTSQQPSAPRSGDWGIKYGQPGGPGSARGQK